MRDTKQNEHYEAPAAQVVGVKTEGVICESKTDPKYNPWDNQTW